MSCDEDLMEDPRVARAFQNAFGATGKKKTHEQIKSEAYAVFKISEAIDRGSDPDLRAAVIDARARHERSAELEHLRGQEKRNRDLDAIQADVLGTVLAERAGGGER